LKPIQELMAQKRMQMESAPLLNYPPTKECYRNSLKVTKNGLIGVLGLSTGR
jgi:hypothetical protein